MDKSQKYGDNKEEHILLFLGCTVLEQAGWVCGGKTRTTVAIGVKVGSDLEGAWGMFYILIVLLVTREYAWMKTREMGFRSSGVRALSW